MTTRDRDAYLGIVLAGWVMAFVLPIGGIIAGFLLGERRRGHAVGMIVVSVVSILAAVVLFASSR